MAAQALAQFQAAVAELSAFTAEMSADNLLEHTQRLTALEGATHTAMFRLRTAIVTELFGSSPHTDQLPRRGRPPSASSR